MKNPTLNPEEPPKPTPIYASLYAAHTLRPELLALNVGRIRTDGDRG